MRSITIDKRFCGPPSSANGGYVCGLLANAIGGCGEVTLRAPPPLREPLEIVRGAEGIVELRHRQTLLATARPRRPEIADVPIASFAEAEDATRRSPYDESNHNLPGCFVCGPARAPRDGLRIFVGPLPPNSGRPIETLAAAWVPCSDLTSETGRVAPEFVWAALDCPTGFAAIAARHLGMKGTEPILLGRMTAELREVPKPGDECVLITWPTGRDGRKLFANSALLSGGEVLATAQATWLLVDRQVQLGQGSIG
jgi:hypothetical protein